MEKTKNKDTKLLLKGVSRFFINALWILLLQIMFSLFSTVMTVSQEDPKEFVKILSVVMTLSVILIVYFVSKSHAYSDFQIYKNNLIRQKHGDAVPLNNIIRQYRWFNAVIFSFIAALPSIVLAIIGIAQGSTTSTAGIIATLINYVYLVPLLNYGAENSLYFIFIAAGISIAASSSGYILQGERLKAQYYEITKGHSNNK